MRNVDQWRPTKIVWRPRRKRYMPNPGHVARGSRFMVECVIPSYLEALRAHAHGRLLDCGCGTVPYFEIYRDQVDEVICIDWGKSPHTSAHVDREVDLNGRLPFDADSFQTVLLADVLEHIAAPGELIAEIARVLAPGGKLIVMVPFLYQLHEAPHDYYRYTRFALANLIQRAGMSVVSLEPLGGYPDVLCDMISKGLAPIGPLCLGWNAAVSLLKRLPLYAHLNRRTHERFPLGYCGVAQKPG